jgi:hypothetical protein
MLSEQDYQDQISEDQRRHGAASLIQKRWRQFQDERLGGMEDDQDDGKAPELSAEEMRHQLVERCKALLGDREHALQQNLAQQRVLAKIFQDERLKHQGSEAPEPSQAQPQEAEAKFWGQVQVIRDKRTEIDAKRLDADSDIAQAKERHHAILEEALGGEIGFRNLVKEMAECAVFPRSGKPIPAKRIQQFLDDEEVLYQQVHEERINYIRLRNKNRKLNQLIKEKEKLNEGLHLIDFEQLKIENTNLNEKIEERNEDLLKLRKKATNTIHTLTHVKEKLEFVKEENEKLDVKVRAQGDQLGALRDRLAHAKKERDVYATDNVKMRENMPMIGAEDLLLDYEVRKKEIENLRIKVLTLTNEHHTLMLWIHSYQPNLEELQRSAAALTS